MLKKLLNLNLVPNFLIQYNNLITGNDQKGGRIIFPFFIFAPMNNSNFNKINYLKEFVTDEKWLLFNKIANQRTRYFTVVLEDIYQAQNSSAVLRTCDAFGIQDIHIIENNCNFKINPEIELGTSQWLTLHTYDGEGNNTMQAVQALKNKGYRIVATTPNVQNATIYNFDYHKQPAAIVFGSEKEGLSKQMLEAADEQIFIPMNGFVQSLNVSVSVAVTMQHLVYNLRNLPIAWQLSEDEKNEIILQWLQLSIKQSHLILEQYEKKNLS